MWSETAVLSPVALEAWAAIGQAGVRQRQEGRKEINRVEISFLSGSPEQSVQHGRFAMLAPDLG